MLSRQLQWWVFSSSLLFEIVKQVTGPESSSSIRSHERHFPAGWPKNWIHESKIRSMNDRDIAKWGLNSLTERKFADAIYCYSKAIEKNPNESSYFRQRGKCYLELDDLETAISDFAKALQMNSQEDVYFFQTAVIKFGKLNDDIKRTIALLNADDIGYIADQLLEEQNLEEALYCFDEAIRKDSSQPRLYRQRAICYGEMKELEMALCDYRESLKLDPENRLTISKFKMALLEFGKIDEPTKETLARLNASELVNFAYLFRKTKQFKEAISCYNEIIKKDDSDATNYVERAYCYKKIGNRERALHDYSRAVRIKPNNWYYLHRFKEAAMTFDKPNEIIIETLTHVEVFELVGLGQHFCSAGAFRIALACYKEAIKKDPNDPKTYIQRGHCYMQMEDREMASRDYGKAVQISPDETEYAYFFREVTFEFGKLNEAVRETLPVLDVEMVFEFGEKFFKQHQFEDALFCYNLAIEKKSSAVYYRQRAKCHVYMNNLNLALSDHRKSAQIKPIDPRDEIDFCEALVNAGEYSAAIKRLKSLEIRNVGAYYARKLKKVREEAQTKELERLRNLIIYVKKLIAENTDHEIRQLRTGNNVEITDVELRGKISELELRRDEYLNKLTSALIDYEKMGPAKSESERTHSFNADDISLYDGPDYFCDKISLTMMTEPVITPSTGITYEKASLLRYLQNNDRDPVSREPLSEGMLIPNKALKEALGEW